MSKREINVKFKNAHDAYWWVYTHPEMNLNGSPPWIEITPHMVCPETMTVEDDESRNTLLEFWVECGPYVLSDEEAGAVVGSLCSSHDWELDCGGLTWEEAVFNLAEGVFNKYGPSIDGEIENVMPWVLDGEEGRKYAEIKKLAKSLYPEIELSIKMTQCGIGTNITVVGKNPKMEWDITDYESW
jgi:hypothetical protein